MLNNVRRLATTAAVRLDLGDLLTVTRSGLFLAAWFLDLNADIAAAGIDPVTHYCRYGWQEGRFPNPYFDPAWYLHCNPDVREAGSEPLLHYIEHGEAEGRRPIGHFDPAWYRATHGVPAGQGCLQHFLQNRQHGNVSPIPEFDAEYYRRQSPDVVMAGMDPFEHYLVRGATEGRNPSAAFDTDGYRRLHLQDRPDVNPLLHFRQHRHAHGPTRAVAVSDTDIPQEVRRTTQPGPLFEHAMPRPPDAPRRATVLAFYLPQFHSIPENDAWWGQGFTEWTNVARGLPRFAGHYQPRIPRDLGHYRLDTLDALRAQVALARGAGLGGFVYYFYWFNGRRLLNGPLDAMLADAAIDFPFCLMWANENWTRRWDGAEQDVLIAQDYRKSDEAGLVAEFARHFADARYIRLQGRPVLMVYRAGLIPDAAQAVARWRSMFKAHGEDPLFVMAQSFDDRDPRGYGMDAAVEFPPHKLSADLPQLNAGLHMLDRAATAQVFAYDGVAAASRVAPSPFPLIRTALPGWDNDARRQGKGMVLHGSTPAKYEAWLTRLIDAAVAQPVFGTPVVCVNAWNEWAEGAYLEPDVHFGSAYLNATGRAIACRDSRPGRTRLLLVGHDAFPAGAQLLLLSLGRHYRTVSGLQVAFLLLGDGALADDYRAVAPTTIVQDRDDLPRLAHAFRAQGFSAAVVNSAASSPACVALAEAGVECTLLVHELPRLLLERNLTEQARDAAAVARHTVFASPFVRDRFAEAAATPPGRAVILPQGLYRRVHDDPAARAAMRARLDLPRDALVAMGLGYADLRKGFDLFLQAWRVAHAAGVGIHLVWIGDIDPSVHAYLGAEVAAAQATGTFRHVPRCADAADWLACADVHLLTSREDPFPSVVLEAMSAGVPTIAFEGAGGAPALLREYGAGVAVPLGDAAAMVLQLRTVAAVSQPADRARLAARTRRDFAFGAYAGRLLRLAMPGVLDVSVVVPTYNYGRYLDARVASIAAQTHPVGEMIVLDDASTDDSAAVVTRAAAAAGRSVRWVGRDSNSGSVFRQWRRAVDLVQGEWLWIAEADDMAEPGFLAALADALQGVPDAVMAFTDSRAVDADGAPLWPDHQAYYARSGAPVLARSGAHPAADLLEACLSRRNLILNASAVLWRRTALRRALDRCGAELDSFTMAGDWRVYAEVLSAGGSVAYVAQPLNIHRRHAASVTHRLAPKLHLAEVSRMHRHMRGLLGSSPALLAGQRQAMQEARAALAAGQLATG